ncbi:hypothetical protein HPB50_005690 [Hyalomma asiaticum]|uniref:Uncharacterized protein n=1 Tax=Hyalomma asiaticum TaxID=266040 RepID=A0ACB7S1Q6_HYAAI|nr:hypothetical protein HPB50_005690 [Hyalomma asiaticum]
MWVWWIYATGTKHAHQLEGACVLAEPANDRTASDGSVDMAAVTDEDVSSQMENWMGNLPEELHNVPLNHLAIPGSHDSCSYTISPQAEIAPDNEYYGNKLLKLLGPIGKQIMYSWSVTQNITTKEQLQAGIRYFDIRIAVRKDPKDDNLYLVHGLFGAVVDNFLVEVKEFLESHKKEVILVHFQHFYNMTDADHNRLLNKLTSVFGPLMCQFTTDLDNITLASLWRRGYQMITFYGHEKLAKYHPYLWPTSYIPNPWPDDDDSTRLVTFWNQTLQQGRDPKAFFVLQAVGTPQPSTVTMHICNSLRFLKAGFQAKCPESGNHTCNIIMSDFVEMNNYRIPRMVVEMNQKLLENVPASEGEEMM